MTRLPETLIDLEAGAETLRHRRFGVIDVADGRLVGVHLRPWPKMVSLVSVLWGQWYHNHVHGDRMRLYFNQPRRFPNFLALKFAISTSGTTWTTAHRSLEVLDEIARIKSIDALLLDAANFRLSPRMLARQGWEPHTNSRWHRNYIKRFYGTYPRLWQPAELEESLAMTA